MHRNPIVRDTLRPLLESVPRVHLIEPPDYVPFVKLMQRATLILTDSGGVQEEAPSLGVPILVLRQTTERPEGVTAGNAKLIGTDHGRHRARGAPAAHRPAAPCADGAAAPIPMATAAPPNASSMCSAS